MPATGSNGFDGRKLAKLFALLDSPQDAEAAGALHRIRVDLKKNGLTFYQAVEDHEYKTGIWEAFGQPECLREYFERKQGGGNEAKLQEEITRLQTALAAREHQTAELIDRYETRLKEVTSAARKKRQYHRGIGEFLSFTWGFAQWRVVLLIILIASPRLLPRWWSPPHWAAYCLPLLWVWFSLLWCTAEIDESGWGPLLMKFVIVGAGCVTLYQNADFALAILGGVTLLVATRLINNLSNRLMKNSMIAAFVGWFV